MHVLTTAPALPTGTLEPSARRSSRCPRACAGVPNTAPVEAGAPRQRSISRRPCAPTCLAPNTTPTRLCPTASAALLLLLLLAVVLVLLVVLLLATCWR
jgi:hypothetical protein